jgi:hypothetical protein
VHGAGRTRGGGGGVSASKRLKDEARNAAKDDATRWVRKLLRLHGVPTIDFGRGFGMVGVRERRWSGIVSDLHLGLVSLAMGDGFPELPGPDAKEGGA